MTEKEKNGELALRPPSVLAPVREKASYLEQVILASGIPIEEEGDDEASLNAAIDIAMRIASAQTVEEVLDPGQTLSGKDLVGKRFVITSEPRGRRSSFQGGLGIYLQFNARVVDTKTGETSDELVSIGALNPVFQLTRLKVMGELEGRELYLYESGETARGYKALWLGSASGEPISGSVVNA